MTPRACLGLAWEALGAHRLRTRLTAAAVAVGTGAVVCLTTLGQSARGYVLDQFAGVGANLCIVLPGKTETGGAAGFVSGSTRDLTLEDTAALRRLPRVVTAVPVVPAAVLAEAAGRTRAITAIGTTAEFVTLRRLRLAGGVNLPAGDPRAAGASCLVGATVRRELFGAAPALGAPLRLGPHRFRVVGCLEPMGEALGFNVDDMVLVPVASALRMLNRAGLFRVLVEVRSHDAVEAAAADVRRLLTERHRVEDVTVVTQQAMMASLGEILALLTAALTAIAAISLGVAGVGVMNVMLVTVVERTPEIGLWKAVGASRRQVAAVFLAEAGLLALGGGVAGLAAGALAAQGIGALVPTLPIATPLWAAEAALGVALAVGLVSGAWPAMRAAALPPVDALRGRR